MLQRLVVAVLIVAGLGSCRRRPCYPDERCVRPISPPPAGCENGPTCYADVARCHEIGDDKQCPADYSCVYAGWPCRSPRDLAIVADLHPASACGLEPSCDAGPGVGADAAADAGCPAGQRPCGMSCIPESSCCRDQDCPGQQQTCEVDAGTCQCRPQMKPCERDCIPEGNCCSDADCPSTRCSGGACQPASCVDGLKNGKETDVDCGGGSCPTCQCGQACLKNVDCASIRCGNETCM